MEIQLWREILTPYDLAVKELIVKLGIVVNVLFSISEKDLSSVSIFIITMRNIANIKNTIKNLSIILL